MATYLADHQLGESAPVEWRGVDEIDAQSDRQPYRLYRLVHADQAHIVGRVLFQFALFVQQFHSGQLHAHMGGSCSRAGGADGADEQTGKKKEKG